MSSICTATACQNWQRFSQKRQQDNREECRQNLVNHAAIVVTYLHRAEDRRVNITTLSSREFNQDSSKAKKAAQNGPVFITDRGKPAHVLLTIEDYRKLTGKTLNIIDLLAMPGLENIEFEPPKLGDNVFQPADLS